ncbi:hypothetical protein Pint_36546 [Pistacia integerrima]|uniref:Uncharacterized protein n=1 Tax=Pistacia integerrima TaxID=434235 RepID=A0ACC0Y0Z8_9ROSI|nr:hypothetical protein Pint_36546 [Pistacia integerrima]
MAKDCLSLFLTVIFFSTILALQALASTDPLDVIVLQDMYMALNHPPQLNSWRSEGGDPCGESWTGVSCSGSSVIYLKLNGLELSGHLGNKLNDLHHLKHLDVSSNNVEGEIPNELPPNVTHINMASNKLNQSIPESLPTLKHLRHLNLSHNLLSGPIGNVFTDLQNLKELDLSYNNFGGDLPSSFGSLKNLSGLFLQNNKFTGSVVYLANLPLTDLNIEDNDFSGVIPKQFQSIPNLCQAPLRTSLPSEQADTTIKGMSFGGIACTVGGVALVVTCAALFISIRINRARAQRRKSLESCDSTLHSLPISTAREYSSTAPEDSPHILATTSPFNLGPRHIPSVRTFRTETACRRSFSTAFKLPPFAKLYTVAELQSVTNNFSEEKLLGQGSLGSVYKAEFPDGQTLAVKNINMVSLSFQEEEQFIDVIRTVSQLRHPNIVTLLGYCVENGQHLLVYEFVRNLSLAEALHSKVFNPLSWAIRLRIALGIARALNYLHSSFSPPVAHCNIKAANILLDEELMPRISDCGIAILRPLARDSVKLKASELAISQTGYIVPEHDEPGSDNTKCDIYAFGVLLLELLTGRKPVDRSSSRKGFSLVTWASSRLHDREYLEQMVDPGIRGTFPSKALSQFADIISLCIQPEKEFRLPMSEIVESLSRLCQKFSLYKGKSVADGTEVDPFERSFVSTHNYFVSSPAVSYLSI